VGAAGQCPACGGLRGLTSPRLQATYTNKTARLVTLKTGGKLHLFSVSNNCAGVVKNGDSIAIIATYAVTPKQKITSP
jgi:hypothetical protein